MGFFGTLSGLLKRAGGEVISSVPSVREKDFFVNVKKLFDLSGKTALITDGSRGLGPQIAEGAPDSLAVRPFAGRGA